MLPLCDPNHPEELIDVISRVADHPTKDDEHIVHAKHPHDPVGLVLCGGHGLTNQGYVAVVPCVVVYECSPVSHTYKYVCNKYI